eukprot:tig00020734_g13555.t1
MAKDPKKPKKPKAAKPQPAQPAGAPRPRPAGQATGTGSGTAPAAGASCAMGMTRTATAHARAGQRLPRQLEDGRHRAHGLPARAQVVRREHVKSDATVVCVGKRRTGKSFFLRDLMFNLSGTFPGGIVISQTDRLNGYWKQYIPQRFIWPKYNRACSSIYSGGSRRSCSTTICQGHQSVLRSNTDLAVIFKCSQAMQREALAKEWGDIISQRAFYYLLDKYTQDNHCLIIDSSNNSTNPLDEYWEGETVNGENLVGPDDGTVDKTLLGMIDNFRKHRGLA